MSFLSEQIFGMAYEYGFANRNVPLSRTGETICELRMEGILKKTRFFGTIPSY